MPGPQGTTPPPTSTILLHMLTSGLTGCTATTISSFLSLLKNLQVNLSMTTISPERMVGYIDTPSALLAEIRFFSITQQVVITGITRKYVSKFLNITLDIIIQQTHTLLPINHPYIQNREALVYWTIQIFFGIINISQNVPGDVLGEVPVQDMPHWVAGGPLPGNNQRQNDRRSSQHPQVALRYCWHLSRHLRTGQYIHSQAQRNGRAAQTVVRVSPLEVFDCDHPVHTHSQGPSHYC